MCGGGGRPGLVEVEMWAAVIARLDRAIE